MVHLRGYATLATVFIVLLACPPGCAKQSGPLKTRPVRTNVEVWRVVTCRMLDEVTLPGVVEPVQAVTVSGEISGKVDSVSVMEGDEVKENQILLVVDKEELDLMGQQAVARVKELEARLREIKSGARQEELAQFNAAVESARSARDLAADQASRRKKLFEDGVIARELFESTQTAFIAAEKRLEQAQESLKLARKGAREETIEINEARLAGARAALQLAKKIYEKAEVRSPISGVIDQKFIEKGELINPGKKLFRIVRADEVKVVVWAPERVMTKVRTGDMVRLSFDALEGAAQARISRIAFAADKATRTFKTEILLDNPRPANMDGPGDRKYRVGYIASVTFEVAEVPRAVRIPIEALVLQGPRLIVYTVKQAEDEKGFLAIANDVEIGLKSRNSVEIRSGIAPGELVVVKGQRFVRDGEAVEVVKTHRGSWPW
jgi:RND family efflux transporter MFP subunit